MLIDNGENVKVTQKLMRHANSKCTLDAYTQARMDTKREAQQCGQNDFDRRTKWDPSSAPWPLFKFKGFVEISRKKAVCSAPNLTSTQNADAKYGVR
jgi:hypothetical protein